MDRIKTSKLNAQAVAVLDNAMSKQIDNTATGNQPLYIGFAPAGTATSAAAWMIQKITYDGNGNASGVTYANVASGAASSSEIWDSRAGLTYT